jgi:hypothetical protein
MPKTGLFTGYPDSGSQIRGQGIISTNSAFLANKRFSIYKEAAQWKATKLRLNTIGYYTLSVPASLLTAKKHYVFRFDVNEIQATAECNKIAAFSQLEWALEFMKTGELACRGVCPHNQECKAVRARIVDDSPYWEVGYFTLSHKRFIFCEYTSRFQALRIQDLD